MKSSGIRQWVAKIHNCFANAKTYLPHDFIPLKSIGDALMYYIEEEDLFKSGFTPMQVYDGLWQLAQERGSDFPDVKVGAAWCEDVYPITFFSGNRDYYGLDIDLTARLQAKAGNKEVVIEGRLRERVMQDFKSAGNADDFVSVKRLVGPEEVELKGITGKVVIYRGR